jgi:hypothetical protein
LILGHAFGMAPFNWLWAVVGVLLIIALVVFLIPHIH